jgi:molybdopterin synthase sulfur carrier subunit
LTPLPGSSEGPEMQNKKVRLIFLSTMKDLVDENGKTLEVDSQATVGDLLELILKRYSNGIARLLFEEDKRSVRNDILILINDVDINVLDGLETMLSENDEVALMPVAHGG